MFTAKRTTKILIELLRGITVKAFHPTFIISNRDEILFTENFCVFAFQKADRTIFDLDITVLMIKDFFIERKTEVTLICRCFDSF